MGGPTVATHIASGKRRRERARRRRRREERRREAERNPLQPDTPTAGVATGEETNLPAAQKVTSPSSFIVQSPS